MVKREDLGKDLKFKLSDSDSWTIAELDRKAQRPAQPNNKQERPKLVSHYYHD